ncbi:hypothetical protein AMS68_001987 [Peltaster fructicola]|uniref:DUF1776-domain-containing protein n=1 Tax=Peltaster fructicola TaxID=286661 RepID=A0A6H0XPR4_9PEZI|nr:hypothetical protein AMS68_001987 [Peltaster fructicola]
MTDAQRFIDSARHHLNDVAADIERHFDNVASQLKDFLSSESPFAPRLIKPPPPPPTAYQAAVRWISKHRAITAAVIAFAITGSVGSAVYYYQRRHHSKKRRARRSASGARTEVVVVAGAISGPLAASVALELERRGYIVYMATGGAHDEHFVRSVQRIDVLPLQLDLTDPYAAQEQLVRFQDVLEKEHVAFEEAEPHKLHLRGLICVPDLSNAPVGSIDTVSSEEWSDALNAKVLNTIATTQLFLPLLKQHAAKLLLMTPSVTSSLLLPGHSVENTVNSALNAYMSTLAVETKGTGLSVTQLKLGNIDIPALSARHRRDGNATSQAKGTPVRKLHDSVFDVLAAQRPARTWYVGRGSFVYDVIGAVAPASAISWMMELGARRHEHKVEEQAAIEGSTAWERVEKEL